MSQHQPAFRAVPAPELLQHLQTTPQGLTGAEARDRLARAGANLLKPGTRTGELMPLLAQFKSPLILIQPGDVVIPSAGGMSPETVSPWSPGTSTSTRRP